MTSKRNILFLSSWYPSRVSTANGDFVARHAAAVAQYAVVTVLYVIHDKNLKGRQSLKVNNNNGIDEYIWYFNVPSKLRFLKWVYYICLYFRGLKIITKRKGKPELIHGNVLFPVGLITLLFKCIYQIPYIFTEHWTIYLPTNCHKLSSWKLILIRKIAKQAEYITPVSMDLRNSMLKLGINANFSIINNVVDTSIFNLGNKFDDENIHLLHISSLKDDHKNVSGILRVVQKLIQQNDRYVLDIISENRNEKLETYTHELGLTNKHVRFHGYMPSSELSKFMTQCDVLLLFSNYENFPCVIVESFACGLPVISTRVGGISEHLTPDKGILIDRGNEEQLFDAITNMFKNSDSINKEELRKYAIDNFSFPMIGKSFIDLYEDILSHTKN